MRSEKDVILLYVITILVVVLVLSLLIDARFADFQTQTYKVESVIISQDRLNGILVSDNDDKVVLTNVKFDIYPDQQVTKVTQTGYIFGIPLQTKYIPSN